MIYNDVEVLEQMNIHIFFKSLNFHLTPGTKIKFKPFTDLNLKCKTMKLLQENKSIP